MLEMKNTEVLTTKLFLDCCKKGFNFKIKASPRFLVVITNSVQKTYFEKSSQMKQEYWGLKYNSKVAAYRIDKADGMDVLTVVPLDAENLKIPDSPKMVVVVMCREEADRGRGPGAHVKVSGRDKEVCVCLGRSGSLLFSLCLTQTYKDKHTYLASPSALSLSLSFFLSLSLSLFLFSSLFSIL